MKSFIKITLILLIVWPKSFFGQTYFNMLYPPEAGTWGGGTQTIVVTDTTYYMNRWAVSNADGMLWFGFTEVSTNGMNYNVLDTIHDSNKRVSLSNLAKDSKVGFVDLSSIINSNNSSQQYGVVKYDSNGHILFHNINSTLYPTIYIGQVIILPDGSIISVGDIDEIGNIWTDQEVGLIKSDSLGNQIWKKNTVLVLMLKKVKVLPYAQMVDLL